MVLIQHLYQSFKTLQATESCTGNYLDSTASNNSGDTIWKPFAELLTHYQTTNFRLFQTESSQTTISNLMKMAESYPNG